MTGLIAVFLVLGVSWALFRFRFVGFEIIPSLSVFVMKVSLPAFVFINFYKSEGGVFDPQIFGTFAAASLILYAIYYAVGRVGFKFPIEHAMLFSQSAVASNSLLMGVAILSLIYGNAIISIVAQIVLFENLILLPLFMIVTDHAMRGGAGGGRAIIKTILRNQFLWAVLLAMFAKSFGLHIPLAFESALEFVGRAVAPVAIFTVGGILARTRFQGVVIPAALGSFGKLILLPILAYTIGRIFGMQGESLAILTLFMAIPNAAIFPIFGEQVKFSEFAGSVFIISYAFAIFTLSAWLMILH